MQTTEQPSAVNARQWEKAKTTYLTRSEVSEFEKMLHPDNGFTVQQVMSHWLKMVVKSVPVIEDVPEPAREKKPIKRTPANRRSKNSLRHALKQARTLIGMFEKALYENEIEMCVNEVSADAGEEHFACGQGSEESSRSCLVHGSGRLFSRLAKWKAEFGMRDPRAPQRSGL